jgi:hypothetical protein
VERPISQQALRQGLSQRGCTLGNLEGAGGLFGGWAVPSRTGSHHDGAADYAGDSRGPRHERQGHGRITGGGYRRARGNLRPVSAASKHSKWWMAPVAILTVSGLAVGAILLAPRSGDSRIPATTAAWDTDCTGALAKDFTCFQQHYQGLVHNNGVAAAFADIKDAYNKSDYVKGNCHQLVHVIGRAAGAHFGDAARAFDQGDDFCSSGYYHGVMEAVIGKIGFQQIRSQLNTICASVSADRKYSLYHYNCVHGLGHGVMAVSSGELFEALGLCDTLADLWERQSCFSGVFMENIVSEGNPDHAHHKTYLKDDDLMYPCNAVEHQYKQQCFLMQTSHALQATGNDFDRVFTLCDAVDDEFRPTCYQSLGRDASGNTISDGIRTRDICMKGRDFAARSNCIIGAVKDFIYYYHSNERGERFCSLLEPTLADSCLAFAKIYSVR